MIEKKYYHMIMYISFLLIFVGCSDPKAKKTSSNLNEKDKIENDTTKNATTKNQQTSDSVVNFVPKNFVLTEKIYGDLNKDGIQDCILMLKGTDKKSFYKHEYRGELDRNRRGLIILFKENKTYKLIVKNVDCFSSENEDGGVYYAPELSVGINKGKLFVDYAHGRYGYWSYCFRFQNADFELIGYDSSSNRGPTVQNKTSINFVTKKELTSDNIYKNEEDSTEVFVDTWRNLQIDKLLKLSEIKDFDEIDVTE